jgi:proteasome lid subunit RPN8/RPN11
MAKTLVLSPGLLAALGAHGERAYPHEACGFLLGRADDDAGRRTVMALLALDNAREAEEQYHRFLITPQDSLHAERAAMEQGLDVIGVYHSHPDHPAEPSAFDREHALPWWTYVITRVEHGRGQESRAWRLRDDRSAYDEELIVLSTDWVQS